MEENIAREPEEVLSLRAEVELRPHIVLGLGSAALVEHGVLGETASNPHKTFSSKEDNIAESRGMVEPMASGGLKKVAGEAKPGHAKPVFPS
jgi:hypothetical protein